MSLLTTLIGIPMCPGSRTSARCLLPGDEPALPDVPARHCALPVPGPSPPRLRALATGRSRATASRATGASASCSSSGGVRSAAATCASVWAPSRRSSRRPSCPTVVSRSAPLASPASVSCRWLDDDPYPRAEVEEWAEPSPTPDLDAMHRENLAAAPSCARDEGGAEGDGGARDDRARARSRARGVPSGRGRAPRSG